MEENKKENSQKHGALAEWMIQNPGYTTIIILGVLNFIGVALGGTDKK